MTFANRLRCEPTLELRACEPFDVWSRDAVHPTLADGRRDVDALHRLAVLPTRRPRALDRQAAAQFVSDLVDGGWPLLDRGPRAKSLRLDGIRAPPDCA